MNTAHKIIMNFSNPPSSEDLLEIAKEVLAILPEEVTDQCDDLVLMVEDFPDESLQLEMELETPYDLLALYRSAKEIVPGVERKTVKGEDTLYLFRRPILDYWCEMEEDLTHILRTVMIEELGRSFEFSEEEIEELTARHHQGLF